MDYTPFRGKRSRSFHLLFPFPATRPIRSRHIITWRPDRGYPRDVCYYNGCATESIPVLQSRSWYYRIDFGTTESILVLQSRYRVNLGGSRWGLEALLDGFWGPNEGQTRSKLSTTPLSRLQEGRQRSPSGPQRSPGDQPKSHKHDPACESAYFEAGSDDRQGAQGEKVNWNVKTLVLQWQETFFRV